MNTYLFLELVFELDELVEELGMDVLYALNRLIVDLVHEIFLWNLLPELLGSTHSLQSLTFLDG